MRDRLPLKPGNLSFASFVREDPGDKDSGSFVFWVLLRGSGGSGDLV